MTPEQLTEIQQRAAHIIEFGGPLAAQHCAIEDVPALVAEVKRLTAELELAFSPGMYLDIQKVLDEALGTKESDGAGAGIVADVALLADRMKTALAERDADRAEIVQLCQERLRLVAERDEARAALDRVRALHDKFVCGCDDDHGHGCKQWCGGDYPCATIRALDGSGT